MTGILGITGPIFVIIGIGFFAVRGGLLSRAEMRPLGVFVIHAALPALLFKTMARPNLGELVSLRVLLAYTVASVAVVAVGLAHSCLLSRRDLRSGAVVAMGMSMSNSAFIGYPIALQAFGAAAAGAGLASYALVESMVMMPLVFTLAEAGGGGSGWLSALGQIPGRLARNPLIVAIALGVGFSLLGLALPTPLQRAVDMLALASAPVALFCIGGTLAGLRLKGLAGEIGLILSGKLLLHPLCVWLVFQWWPEPDSRLQSAAIVNAAMPMMSIYPLLSQKYGHEDMATAALIATTFTSFFTLSGLLWLMGG